MPGASQALAATSQLHCGCTHQTHGRVLYAHTHMGIFISWETWVCEYSTVYVCVYKSERGKQRVIERTEPVCVCGSVCELIIKDMNVGLNDILDTHSCCKHLYLVTVCSNNTYFSCYSEAHRTSEATHIRNWLYKGSDTFLSLILSR